ncbi:DNA-binding transcriptional response regulator, NtrC family, contains REC, AAA-type ATPase, and a Fis-type DNA-binding domains [Chryseolinea serpens]|uniref:DNA-binding transcriptional response regulator, NtrC family, contains REC, AAA-type ATPase, and a Fis-type DNA-binding domains n=1 Tax=Chryseolinea serpens TaxID=947013 RepID=A0A1M5VFR2_9BACT|nr:sigma-54 dependent transcriptional regulator [Chryseolinea serpens]SHH73753.1 DNA-binding transcriptional response regulator, NtrC family, contains REC, AAA-type ATPase, and a Fis-type DNA-binding domains [Chryseolinea serpens]
MEQKQGKILIVDDNEDLLKAAKMHLKRHFAQVDIEKNPEALPALMNNEDYDVILLDMNFTKDVSSGSEGYYWLERILQQDPSAVVVLITAYGDIQMAVKAIKAGATDFVLKPWENEKLQATLYSAMRLRESRDVIETLKIKNQEINQVLNDRYSEIIGQSATMQKIFSTIDRVAKTDANVLILGENGTGKELIARAIHRNSSRKNENFASVDLGSITETLFESELFGHKKGSFTDAKEDRAGRFELANNGTLFLDEIGNLSMPLQAKLLTVLQNRKVSRVGSNKDTPIDIRLICATNMPLYDMVKENRFRQDLLYRINTIEIEIPALRERFEDIPLLANHFLKHYAAKYDKPVTKISEGAMSRMHKHPWPGNIRELQHAIERAIILSSSNVLQPEDFNFTTASAAKEDGQLSLEQYNLEEVEKLLIRKVLKKYNGNITQAASELGLTRSSLYRRLEKYGL